MRQLVWAATGTAVVLAFVLLLSGTWETVPPLGRFADPVDGLYHNARHVSYSPAVTAELPFLNDSVEVVRDARAVPHIYAQSAEDAVAALGYVSARDRLFQMDFLPRVAGGELSEVFGRRTLSLDRYLRSTGMRWGAEKNMTRIREEGGIELRLLQAYSRGVNAYLATLDQKDLPPEFRLLEYEPKAYSPLRSLLTLQYFGYRLTFRSDRPTYSVVRSRIGGEAFRQLYPSNSLLYVPMVPEKGGWPHVINRQIYPPADSVRGLFGSLIRDLDSEADVVDLARPPSTRGLGSNSFGIHEKRSESGQPLLASDIHMGLTLPALWYETHMVTPSMNSYGVTIPGWPLPMEGFNNYLGWSLTNTRADQIDHYTVEIDTSGTVYRHRNAWREIRVAQDTIQVKGSSPVIDTLRYTHWGPLIAEEGNVMAIHWTLHEPNSILEALWHMHRAGGYQSFQEGLRYWDAPVENILYADVWGNLAVRSTGYIPVRAEGHGRSLLDGSTTTFSWIGRVPFNELPHSYNPEQQFLATTNQQPTDASYPHYINYNWGGNFRSLRLDSLLRNKPSHDREDVRDYLTDRHVVQWDLFRPLVRLVDQLSPRADTLRTLLERWDGRATPDAAGPVVLHSFLENLEFLAWDELRGYPMPHLARLLELLQHHPTSPWIDRAGTEEVEDAEDLLRQALERTVDSLSSNLGWNPESWKWGEQHQITIQHLTRSERFQSFGRGPFPFPGFSHTLLSAPGRSVTRSSTWRMIIDFADGTPAGWGMYPGGQSGQPFSRFYDHQVDDYLNFRYYRLLRPLRPDRLPPSETVSRIDFVPESNS